MCARTHRQKTFRTTSTLIETALRENNETSTLALKLPEGLILLREMHTTLWQDIDSRLSAFAQAIRANPEKVEAMTRNIPGNNITHAVVEVLLRRYFQVPHNAAVFAHKMIVLIHCRVVTMKPFSKIEFLNLSLSCEDVEVSIDCAKRNARYLRSDLLIHPLCRWMGNGLFQDLIDFLALSTPFCPDGLHGTAL